MQEEIQPREIAFSRQRLKQVRHALCGGTPHAAPMLLWPFRDLSSEHDCYVAVNRLAARGGRPLDRRQVDFLPAEPATKEWASEGVRLSLSSKQVALVRGGDQQSKRNGQIDAATSHWKTLYKPG